MSKQPNSKPIRTNPADFDELFREMCGDWQQKARALQARRWRVITRGQGEM